MSPPRLLLFDVDGTLLEGGPAKEAFQVALVATFGTPGDIEVHDFAGKTDPQIARELLSATGLRNAEIEEGFPRLWARYLQELEARLPATPMDVLPGVVPLLDALTDASSVELGLVTGNIAAGARLKLGSAGLFDPFRFGAYGSDAEDRDRLPAVALARARELLGVDVSPDQATIVGDTPRDVACGHAHGLATLAVATGRFGRASLERAGADIVLDDLGDTTRVVDLLTRALA